jgi:hypothetical protein
MSAGDPVALRAAAPQPTPASRAPRRGFLVALLAALLAAGSLAAAPAPASAAGIKVAIVVGPAGSLTSRYISHAREYAAKARAHGATVVEVYTPRATWSRVRSAVQGANLLIYLGHGNGFPNPYNKVLTPLKVDGFGLNGSLTSGNTATTYYGEYYVRTAVKLAPNAVVVLNHLCYSAGSSEPGRADPSLSVARRRVDNFAAGFLRTGAKAVFAETLGDISYVIDGLFTSEQSIEEIFWSSWSQTGTYQNRFASARTPGMTALMDPRAPTKFYRSVVGNLAMAASTWRGVTPTQ